MSTLMCKLCIYGQLEYAFLKIAKPSVVLLFSEFP